MSVSSAIRYRLADKTYCLSASVTARVGCALQNGVYTVGGSIETPVTRSKVYDMLIDYPNLNKIFSSIDECHTLTEKQALQLLQVAGIDMSGPVACLRHAKQLRYWHRLLLMHAHIHMLMQAHV